MGNLIFSDMFPQSDEWRRLDNMCGSIILALKLTGFLKYDLFEKVNSEEEPTITITYFLKNGTSKTISANNTTVWWNNKIHVIKDKEMFINLTEGIFFLEDLQT